MTEKTNNRIHLIYGIVLSVALSFAAACLIAACLSIYYAGGDTPFTPESVANAWRPIAVPVYVCLALVAGGLILEFFIPRNSKKLIPIKQHHAVLEKLHKKLQKETCDPDLYQAIHKESTKRANRVMIATILFFAGSLVFLVYGLNPDHFDTFDVNGSMIKAVRMLGTCIALPFAYSIVITHQNRHSLLREIELVKDAIHQVTISPTVPKKTVISTNKPDPAFALRYVILGLAVTLVIYGLLQGGTGDVLTKAVNICTECVGLG